MNLSVIYILAFSTIVTFVAWLILIMFVLVFRLTKAQNANHNKPHTNIVPPQPTFDEDEENEYIQPEQPVSPTPQPTQIKTPTPSTHEEGTRSTADFKPMAENSDNDQSTVPQIKIDNKETLRKAIIYHEIFDTKF